MARKGYHHGNLKQALVEATIALIEEKGPTGFTMAEAAKHGFRRAIVPRGNAPKSPIPGIDVRAVGRLSEALGVFD